MGTEAECCCLLQGGQEEYSIPWSDMIGSCDRQGDAHTYAQPPAGTKGPEAPARAPVPAFPAQDSKDVGNKAGEKWNWDTVTF